MRATGAPPRQQSHSELRMLRASERRHKRAGPATREAAASATLGGRGGGVTVEATAVDCSPTCRRVTTPSCRSDQPPPLSDPPRAPAAPCQVCCRQRLEHVTRADCPSPHATAVAGCPRRVVVRACVAATDGEGSNGGGASVGDTFRSFFRSARRAPCGCLVTWMEATAVPLRTLVDTLTIRFSLPDTVAVTACTQS